MSNPDSEDAIAATPRETGTDQHQERQDPQQSLAVSRRLESTLTESHFGKAIDEISEIRSGAAMHLVVAGVRQLAADNQAIRHELRETQAERDLWREKYFEEKISRAVLESHENNRPRIQRLQHVALAVGGIIGGVGVPMLMSTGSLVVGSLLTVAGGVLLAIGGSRLREKR